MKKVDVSIIIVTYNAQDYILPCLRSIASFAHKSTEIVIVDNNSSDETTQYILTSPYKQIHLIKNKKNDGFAKACNQAANVSTGDYLIFVNPDSYFLTSYSSLIDILKKKRKVGIAGCLVKNPNRTIQPSCGNFPTTLNLLSHKLPLLNRTLQAYVIQNSTFYKQVQYPDWISGVCFSIKKSVFTQINGFNENYFMYGEDVDLCKKVEKLNYSISFSPKTKIVHYDSGKSKKRKPNKYVYLRLGLLRFTKAYNSTMSYSIINALILSESIFKLLGEIISNRDPQLMRAYKKVIHFTTK